MSLISRSPSLSLRVGESTGLAPLTRRICCTSRWRGTGWRRWRGSPPRGRSASGGSSAPRTPVATASRLAYGSGDMPDIIKAAPRVSSTARNLSAVGTSRIEGSTEMGAGPCGCFAVRAHPLATFAFANAPRFARRGT